MFRIFCASLLFITSFNSIVFADTIVIGNTNPLNDWNRAQAAVRVYDATQSPPFRTLGLDESSGSTAGLSGIVSGPDGLLSASSFVNGYGLSGAVSTSAAPEGIYVASQLRDQIFVDADFNEDSVLEFEFTLDYGANVADPGFAEFQFTLFALDPSSSFLFLDNASSVDFGLGDGPYEFESSRTFTVTTAMSGLDEVLITSGSYVPLQFTLTGVLNGTGSLDYLNTLELTGFSVLDGNGQALSAYTSSAQDPSNPFLNTNPVPEPSGLSILIPLFGIALRIRRR